MSTVLLDIFKKSHKAFDPVGDSKHLCGPMQSQGLPLITYKAVYEAATLKKDIIRIKEEQTELMRKLEDAEAIKKGLKDDLDNRDNLDARLVVGLEAELAGKAAHLTQATEQLQVITTALAEEELKVHQLKDTCANLENKVERLSDTKAALQEDCERLRTALEDAKHKAEDARRAAEGHRRILANLNASLVTESAVKQELEKESVKVNRALREAQSRVSELEAERLEILQVQKVESEEALADLRNDKAALSVQLQQAVENIINLQNLLDDSTKAQVAICAALDEAHSELASSKVLHTELQTNLAVIQNRLDALLSAHSVVLSEKNALEHALAQAELNVGREMTSAGEALTALYLEQEKTKDLQTKLSQSHDAQSALHLARQRNQYLEAKLVETDLLLTSTKQRAATAECELDGLKYIREQGLDHVPVEDEVVFDADMFELELERDMYMSQEQEALAARDAEKALRLAAETERDFYRQQHDEALALAENNKDDKTAQLQAALAQIAQLNEQLQQEQDTNAVIRCQLNVECDANAHAREGLQSLQTRLTVATKERDEARQELQASCESHHALAATNKALSCDLTEKTNTIEMLKMQVRFQPSSDEDAQTFLADLAKENVALKASKKSVEAVLASKVERCEGLQKELVRLRAQVPLAQASTPSRAALADKENNASVTKAQGPARSSSTPLGPASLPNPPSSPVLPSSPTPAGMRNRTPSRFFNYFVKKNVAADLPDRDASDGATSDLISPVLS